MNKIWRVMNCGSYYLGSLSLATLPLRPLPLTALLLTPLPLMPLPLTNISALSRHGCSPAWLARRLKANISKTLLHHGKNFQSYAQPCRHARLHTLMHVPHIDADGHACPHAPAHPNKDEHACTHSQNTATNILAGAKACQDVKSM